ncbi:MAG: hypothetical protein AB7O97_22260 [Planctomycetota bacterium]
MTRPYLDDAIDDERADEALTAALRDHFDDQRPDPEAFAAEVRARAERLAQRPRPKLPGYLRAAAALLPPVVLPEGLAAGVSSAVATKASLKLVPAALALPAATLAMIVVTAWFVLRRLFAGANQDGAQFADPKRAEREVAAWWRQHGVLAGGAFLGSMAMILLAPIEAATLLLLLSTLALFLVWSRLAQVGLASRSEIGRRAAGSLVFLAAFSMQISQPALLDGLGQVGSWLVTPLLAGTAAICALFSGDRRRRQVLVGSLLLFALSLGLIGAHFGIGLRFGRVTITTADAVAWIERGAPSGRDYAHAGDVARCVAMLEAAGLPRPDLRRFAADLHERLDRDYRAGSFNDLYAPDVAALGLARPSDWAEWFDAYRDEHLFDRDRALRSAHDRLPVMVRAAQHGLTAAQRDVLAERVLLAALEPKSFDSVPNLLDNANLLEFLGHAPSVPRLRERTLELLRARWVRATGTDAAAFAPHPQTEPSERLTFVWLDDTIDGVEAMLRFGAPDYVDVAALARYLQAETHQHRRDSLIAIGAKAACALAALRAMPGYRDRVADAGGQSLLEPVMQYRLLGAVTLLCAVALLITLRSPKAAVQPGPAT